MKKFTPKPLSVLIILAILSLGAFHRAFAMTPYVSLSSSGYNGQIQATVNGDPNASITLEDQGAYGAQNLGTIGTTDQNGYFSAVINTASYNIPTGTPVFVLVNGQQSASVAWPNSTSSGYYTNGGVLSLSETSLSLSYGQSATVTAYNANGGSLYVSSSTNQNIASAAPNGNGLMILGLAYGSTTMTVCSTTTSCTSLYVTVTTYGAPGSSTTTLSQTSATVAVGQTQNIQLYGSSYNDYVENVNTGIVSTSISGSTLVLYGISQGSATLEVCSNYQTPCAVLYVTVTGYGSTYPSYTNTYPTYTTPGYQTYPNYTTTTYPNVVPPITVPATVPPLYNSYNSYNQYPSYPSTCSCNNEYQNGYGYINGYNPYVSGNGCNGNYTNYNDLPHYW